MRFPEFLWSPTEQDVLKGAAVFRHVQILSTSGAAGSLQLQFPRVPLDRIFILTNLHARATAGAAQLPTNVSAFVNSEQGETLAVIDRSDDPATGNALMINLRWQGEVLIMPAETIRTIAFFDAAVAVNSFQSSVHWYDIPRGNLQFG